ncbi:PilZ domain-containing protein [Bryobacter aggregatus]|uniref:PilZ domain-containing protein n=1 Tax=Bryobacter aggregatus TaxID=360054 RepID=UPI00138E35A1|nr:PilZ domain-containing protein [Bryobacter aggregatus]
MFGLQMAKSSSKDLNDRRGADRFPIEREVRYKVLSKRSNDEAGIGKTINMSSSGVLFTSEHSLVPGKRIEIAISWPAQLNNKTPLKLVARGRVIRCEDGRAALEIQQYEFRTQGSTSLQ